MPRSPDQTPTTFFNHGGQVPARSRQVVRDWEGLALQQRVALLGLLGESVSYASTAYTSLPQPLQNRLFWYFINPARWSYIGI